MNHIQGPLTEYLVSPFELAAGNLRQFLRMMERCRRFSEHLHSCLYTRTLCHEHHHVASPTCGSLLLIPLWQSVAEIYGSTRMLLAAADDAVLAEAGRWLLPACPLPPLCCKQAGAA